MADQHQQERSLHQKCRHCCQPVTTAAADLQDHGVSSRLDSGSHTSQQTSHTVRSRAAKFIHIPGRPPSSSTYLFWHSVKSHGTPTCQLDMHDILLQGGTTYCCKSLTCSASMTLTITWVLLVPMLLCFHSGKLPSRQGWCYHNTCPSTSL